MYAVYSCKDEGSSSGLDCYIVDIHPDRWDATTPNLHIRYRNVWPGSIIHMSSLDRRRELLPFQGPKWHLGEK